MDDEDKEQPQSDEEVFLKTLDEKELMAYHIAKSHLGSLFSLDKSNAYLEWKAKQKSV